MNKASHFVATETLSTLLIELVEQMETEPSHADASVSWTSDNARIRIDRVDNLGTETRLLDHNPDDYFAEYALILDGATVFRFREYVWPHLILPYVNPPSVELPDDCMNTLYEHHANTKAQLAFIESLCNQEAANDTEHTSPHHPIPFSDHYQPVA